MANPFGECDDDEYDRFQTKSRSNSSAPSGSCPDDGTNPFGEPEEPKGELSNRRNLTNSFQQNVSIGSSKRFSQSRQSLDSNANSDVQSNASNSYYVGSYTLGEGSVQKEGLLCPECLTEFRQITELLEHSEKFHSAGASSANRSNQFKELITKIKTKAKNVRPNFDLSDSIDEKNFDPTFNPIEDWKLSMAPGPRRSHFDSFKKMREVRIERYVFETNKLLIRLDKLLRDYPFDGDSNERREHEQTIVTWIDDALVNLCPTCTMKFNILTRKKHHCRLCGAVMCTKCSKFITFESAYKLVASFGSKVDERKQRLSVTPSSGANLLSKLAVASPLANDLVNTFESKLDSVRVCFECEKLLVIRQAKLETACSIPPVVELYKQLQEHMAQFDEQLPKFLKVAESINNGDSIHSQTDLQNLKRGITRTGEVLDLLSKKIEISGLLPAKRRAELDPHEVQRLEPSQKQKNLQKAVRRATVLYLKKLQQAHSIAIQTIQQ